MRRPNWLPKPTTAVITALVVGAATAGTGAGILVGHFGVKTAGNLVPGLQRAKTLTNRDGSAPPADGHEVVTWAASPTDLGTLAGFGVPAVPVLPGVTPPAADYRTARDIVHTSVGGWYPRIRLSNEFGTKPVTFDDVEAAIDSAGTSASAADAASALGPERELTFGGQRTVTIPPGAEALSDPLPGYLAPGVTLAVSIHVARGSGQVTGHPDSFETNLLSRPGDFAAALDGSDWSLLGNWLYLDGIEVTVPKGVGTVVALGDSITDGVNSTPDANDRWPDDLARRLLALPEGQQMAVANEGLASNQVTTSGHGLDGGRDGLSAQTRFDSDVLAQSGVTTVILFEGINDIGDGSVRSARQLIAAYTELIGEAHAAGLRILGGTLTPFAGTGYYSPAKEKIRQQVNDWIRTSAAFDGVIDFDKAVRDPADPARFTPAYDSGDHIHPSPAGYQAMADAVNLSLLR